MGDDGNVLVTGFQSVHPIVARMLEARLVEQGIVNQPLTFRRLQKNFAKFHVDEKLRITYDPQKLYTAPDCECWAPPDIPRVAWDNALRRFVSGDTLWRNLDRFLLPLLSGAAVPFPYEEILLETRRRLVEAGLLMTPVRRKDGATFYFDESETYCFDRGTRFPYDGMLQSRDIWKEYELLNLTVWAKAAKSFQVGESLLSCIEVFFQTGLYTHAEDRETLGRLVTRIYPPEYERMPENANRDTFDRVRVLVGLSTSLCNSWGMLRQTVHSHRSEIDSMVIKRIATDHNFKRFGVPVGFLHLSDLLLRRDYSLEYIFELKGDGENLNS